MTIFGVNISDLSVPRIINLSVKNLFFLSDLKQLYLFQYSFSLKHHDQKLLNVSFFVVVAVLLTYEYRFMCK